MRPANFGMPPIIQTPTMTPEQFVFWLQGFVQGRDEAALKESLGDILEALQGVYVPQAAPRGCGCGGKG